MELIPNCMFSMDNIVLIEESREKVSFKLLETNFGTEGILFE